MPEFTRTKTSVRRRTDDGTINLLGFVDAHEQGKMTDALRDEIVELLNRGTHHDALVEQLKRNRQGLENLLEFHWIENPGHRQAIREVIIEINGVLRKAGIKT